MPQGLLLGMLAVLIVEKARNMWNVWLSLLSFPREFDAVLIPDEVGAVEDLPGPAVIAIQFLHGLPIITIAFSP